MKPTLTILAIISLFAALINLDEVRRDPDTKGWGVGLGLLAFVGFGAWAIAS